MRDWSTGLCDCCIDRGAALDLICCWPCQIGRQWAASDMEAPEPDRLSPLGCLLSLCFAPCCSCVIRTRVAERYMLEENCIASVLLSLCCCPCSLCQTHREMTQQSMWPGGTCCSKENPALRGHQQRRLKNIAPDLR